MTLILSGTDGLSDVDGSAATPAIRGTDANTGIFFPAADTIAFSEGGVEAMRITSAGNVGIGTTSPTGALQISNATPLLTGGSSQLNIFSTDAIGADKGGRISFGGVSGAVGFDPYGFCAIAGLKDNATASNFSGYLTFSTSTSGGTVAERMRIDSSGNVGIGTNSPSYPLDVVGATNSIYTRLGSSGRGLVFSQFQTSSVDNAGHLINASSGVGVLAFATNSTERARIDSSGNLIQASGCQINSVGTYANTTATAANMVVFAGGGFGRGTSALKYKQDIRELESIDITKFKPVRYKSKCENDDQTKDHFGFIADWELEAGHPELVILGENGEVEGFQYERMTAVLTKVVQELKALVDTQASTITQLQADVAVLKGTP
jgi:hypothetical protein